MHPIISTYLYEIFSVKIFNSATIVTPCKLEHSNIKHWQSMSLTPQIQTSQCPYMAIYLRLNIFIYRPCVIHKLNAAAWSQATMLGFWLFRNPWNQEQIIYACQCNNIFVVHHLLVKFTFIGHSSILGQFTIVNAASTCMDTYPMQWSLALSWLDLHEDMMILCI